MALLKRSLKLSEITPVKTSTMIRAATRIRILKAFLIMAPRSSPIMKGRTIGIIQASSGGIDKLSIPSDFSWQYMPESII